MEEVLSGPYVGCTSGMYKPRGVPRIEEAHGRVIEVEDTRADLRGRLSA
jgi:hypothetical protein